MYPKGTNMHLIISTLWVHISTQPYIICTHACTLANVIIGTKRVQEGSISYKYPKVQWLKGTYYVPLVKKVLICVSMLILMCTLSSPNLVPSALHWVPLKWKVQICFVIFVVKQHSIYVCIFQDKTFIINTWM